MSIIYLKVKVKSLAEESKIIRLEERRSRSSDLRAGLAEHRRGILRSESRSSLLAYGYLRGRQYRIVERTTRPDNEPDWGCVERMVKKYGPPRHNVSFDAWKAQA